MNTLQGRRISVIGENRPSKENYRLAYELGRFLGSEGCVVFNGGLGGVMEAVSKGVRETGGTSIGLLPGLNPSDANRYIDLPIVTGIGYARNILVANNGEIVIAIGGRFGTLNEISYALNSGIPVLALHSWELHRKGECPENYYPVESLVELKTKIVQVLQRL